jgi:hypothetical protein
MPAADLAALARPTRVVIPELEIAITEIQRTTEILRRSSCDRWADELERLLGEVRSGDPYTQKEGLFHVGECCHPKALGDAYVMAVDSQTWQAQLERLHDLCARAFNRLERGTA